MMSTTTSTHVNSALSPPTPHKCAYQAAEKAFSNKSPNISLLSLEGLNAPSSDPLPSGASFLLEIHRRREKSHNCAYQAAEKPFSNKSPHMSLLSLEGLDAPSSGPLPSGASFLLEIHRRREKSATPSQKVTRKERTFLDKFAAPSQKITGTPVQRWTKKERNLLLEKAVNLAAEDS
jgi:hypothetical protein